MKRYARYGLPVLLTMVGGALLIVGLMQGRSASMLVGASLALAAGLTAFALQAEIITKRTGAILGFLFLFAAGVLALRNYLSEKRTAILERDPIGSYTEMPLRS
ncbi:MAG: hypothetical protein WAR83_03385 [Flavobacteriales bacterium]|jgi:hypothetical protein|nr:hypothetical protein [Flavobacteriales bacterium]